MKLTIPITVAMLLISSVAANAQTTVATAGGEAGSISYTVGQPFTEPATSESGSIAPGVQQAFVITAVEVGIGEIADAVTLEAYPNPVSDRLTLSAACDASLRYTLTDANGRVLLTDNVSSDQTTIGMSQYAPAVYLLRVADGETIVKTFRIVKN